MATVAVHAALSPAASWAMTFSCQSEEETEQRHPAGEEEVAEVMGTAPPRGAGAGRIRAPYWQFSIEVNASGRLLARLPDPRQPSELASRNGLGAPLRC